MRAFRRATMTEADAQPFLTDVEAIHSRLRRRLLHEARPGGPDTATIRRLLNEVLASELAWVLRYKSHYFAARGTVGDLMKAWFLDHALEQQQHADRIANRIRELGGRPEPRPAELADRTQWSYATGGGFTARVREDLVAERVTLRTYRELIRILADRDPETRRLLEDIVATEAEHAEGLLELLRAPRLVDG